MASTRVSIDTQVRVREQVLDKISKLDPYTRPILASIGRQDLSSTKPEWTLQELKAPSKDNAVVHGYDTVFAATNFVKRVEEFNYTQLLDKPVAVDLSAEAVIFAGVKKMGSLTDEKANRSVELLNDVEASIVSSNDRVQPLPDTTTAGKLRGMERFINSNAIVAGSGAFPETVATPGMWTRLQVLIKKAGGVPNKAFMGLEAWDEISSWFNKNITREVGNSGRKITSMIHEVEGVAGVIGLVYESNLSSVILMLETGRWNIGWLREPKWYPYPEGISDFHGGTYKAECSLVSWAEKANGKITGLTYTA